MSVPPPSTRSTPPPGEDAPPREFVVRLEERRSRARFHGGEALLRLSAGGLEIRHGEWLLEPLKLPLSSLKLAALDPGGPKAGELEGRLPILRRLSAQAVVPREEGIDGWLWTRRGGSALPALGAAEEAPNGALLFAKPLQAELVRRTFMAGWVHALAARSPLGEPAVPGLLLRLADPVGARHVLERFGLLRPLTDREIPPAMRRALPGDIPANPTVRGGGSDPRAATSVGPPGMG